MTDATGSLRLERDGADFRLAGEGAEGFGLVNEYLGYLADRNYSACSVRAYGFDLLAFCRWLADEHLGLDAVTTEVLLRFMAACRAVRLGGRPGPNVVSLRGPPRRLRPEHHQPPARGDRRALRLPSDA